MLHLGIVQRREEAPLDLLTQLERGHHGRAWKPCHVSWHTCIGRQRSYQCTSFVLATFLNMFNWLGLFSCRFCWDGLCKVPKNGEMVDYGCTDAWRILETVTCLLAALHVTFQFACQSVRACTASAE